MQRSRLLVFVIGVLGMMTCSAEGLDTTPTVAVEAPVEPVSVPAAPGVGVAAPEAKPIVAPVEPSTPSTASAEKDNAPAVLDPAPVTSESATPAPSTDSSVVLPGLPLSVTDPKSRSKAVSAPLAMMSQAPLKMTVEPGRTIFLDVAINQMNRFITPWKKPRIVSAHEVTHYVRGNAVYIAPSGSEPLGIYITSGDESQAISLGLFPKAIPPREVTLEMPGVQVTSSSDDAEKWETSTDYLTTITQLLEDTAHGNIPPGYGLRQPNDKDALYLCDMPGLTVSKPLQVLDGGHLAVHIMKVTNTGSQPIEAQEHTCLQDGVAAAAVSPPAVLEAGESREMYLVVKMDQGGFQAQVRPRVDN